MALSLLMSLLAVSATKQHHSTIVELQGHYPSTYCQLTNAVFNPQDGGFYYDATPEERCAVTKGIWLLINSPKTKKFECDIRYPKGQVFTTYFWFGSNYFHLHNDLMLPLNRHMMHTYHGSNRNLFMPSVESSRLKTIDWSTTAFDDDSKYWMAMLKALVGAEHDMMPMNTSLLTSNKTICFDQVSFGIPHVDFQDKVGMQQFIAYTQNQLNIKLLPFTEHRIGLISRKNRRRITNEPELVEAMKNICPVDLLELEKMSFREQVQAMQKYSVLVGMNGAGLMNGLYLPPWSTVVQLVPFDAHLNNIHFGNVLAARGPYFQWENEHRENHHLPEGVYDNGQADTKVDVEEFTKYMDAAMRLANAHRVEHEEL